LKIKEKVQKIVIAMLLMSLVSIVGCKTSTKANMTSKENQIVADKSKLKREWVLKSVEQDNEANKILQSLKNKPFINLTENVKGFGGCNTIGGGVIEAKDDKISFEKIYATRKACIGNGDKIETIFLAILNNTKAYKIEGHFLKLYDENEKKLATLVAMDWD
jgi:heat shock protein HslJ